MNTGSDMDGFGKLLRRLRGAKVSQGALARRAGTSQSYVSRVEAGEIDPSLRQAAHLANSLGYRLRVELEPMRARSDLAGLPQQLAMTAEERMQSAAALHNTVVQLKRGLE
jgi:transcriptional regulator with XRE-family HTH domain